jgi:preprotein translocase subunit SecG
MFIYYLAICLFLFLSVLLCFVILIQKSSSMGLGSSFGGESKESIFGTSTADILKKITYWLAIIFMISSVVLSLWTSKLGNSDKVTPKDFIESGM